MTTAQQAHPISTPAQVSYLVPSQEENLLAGRRLLLQSHFSKTYSLESFLLLSPSICEEEEHLLTLKHFHFIPQRNEMNRQYCDGQLSGMNALTARFISVQSNEPR